MEDSKESRLRAEFEAWYSDGGEYPLACQRAKDGGYMLAQAESSWTAWQAAYRAASASSSEILEALNRLLRHVDSETCEHEDTYRGGAIWTICRDCGRKWADNRGGFVPHKDAPPVANVRALLAKYQGE